MDRYLAFLKVLEQGSFTKAADALGYSQSAVSQMIQSLEAELELTLLHRGHRGVKLSPEGESLLPYIQSSVNHYNAMLEAVRDMKHLEGGLIRIGTLSSYSSQWLPPLIKEFKAILEKHRGNSAVQIQFELNGNNCIMELGHRWRVQASPQFNKDMDAWAKARMARKQ